MDKRVLLLPLTLFLFACATSQGSGTRRSMSVLTADEIAEAAVLTAAEAIQRCRPQWLQRRGPPTIGSIPPTLYVDGVRWDDFTELDRIRAEMVERMEFLSSLDATNRFGVNHDAGAILVTTR